jgi:hypothetical protein
MATGYPVKTNYATGDILTAANMQDLSGTVNLTQSTQFAAGKNAIINGDFGIWQRGTSFTTVTGTLTYTADRWGVTQTGTGTTTTTQQTFTPGTAPVSGYEGTYFMRLSNAAGTTYCDINQRIEDVRIFAGQTVTLSFWAKASSSITFTPLLRQNFGSGGSGNVDTIATNAVISSSSWTRYTASFTVPSISGKTIGTSSYLALILYSTAGTVASNTIDIWGVQVEAASTASNFQTATGTKQGELAACQRYYYRSTSGNAFGSFGVSAVGSSATIIRGVLPTPVTLRVSPTSIDFSTLCYLTNFGGSVTAITNATIYATCVSLAAPVIEFTTTGGAANTYYQVIANNSATAYIGLSAEL